MSFDHWIHFLELFIVLGIAFVVSSVVRASKSSARELEFKSKERRDER